MEEFTNNQKKVLLNALDHYGAKRQTIKAMEESGELIQSLAKIAVPMADDTKCKQDLAGEIADMEIMLAQMKHLYGLSAAVQLKKDYKLHRLEKRMRDEITAQKLDLV